MLPNCFLKELLTVYISISNIWTPDPSSSFIFAYLVGISCQLIGALICLSLLPMKLSIFSLWICHLDLLSTYKDCLCGTSLDHLCKYKSSLFEKEKFIYLFIFGYAGSSLLLRLFPSCDEWGATL